MSSFRYEYQHDPTLDAIHPTEHCPGCDGKITVGELRAAGCCSACYFDAEEDDSLILQTGEH